MDADNKPILARRFKTKLCDKWLATGVCKYGDRCVFAHGPEELRTKSQNVRAGLVRADAVRAFQRSKNAESSDGAATPTHGDEAPPELRTVVATSMSSVSEGDVPTPTARRSSGTSSSSKGATPRITSPRGYQHNPYAYFRLVENQPTTWGAAPDVCEGGDASPCR